MPKIVTNNIQNMDIQIDEYDLHPELTKDIQQTLSRLLGWHDGTERFLRVKVDADGRVLVSTSPTQASVATNSVVTANATGVVLFNSNGSRRQYIIYNNSSGVIYVSFGNSFVLSSALPIPSGGLFADDVYTGAIYVGTSTGSGEVRGVEM